MKELEELIKEYEDLIEKDFNFNWEHYENGNYDDSFEYGVESGQQYAYMDIIEDLKKLQTILKNK